MYPPAAVRSATSFPPALISSQLVALLAIIVVLNLAIGQNTQVVVADRNAPKSLMDVLIGFRALVVVDNFEPEPARPLSRVRRQLFNCLNGTLPGGGAFGLPLLGAITGANAFTPGGPWRGGGWRGQGGFGGQSFAPGGNFGGGQWRRSQNGFGNGQFGGGQTGGSNGATPGNGWGWGRQYG